jgi:hypothetical protein
MHRLTETTLIQTLPNTIGRLWGNFLFPFETDTAVDGRVRDLFVDCIPYFMTQRILYMFVLISAGLPETTTRRFRMQVCGKLVKIFTMIEPLESLLRKMLVSTSPDHLKLISLLHNQ